MAVRVNSCQPTKSGKAWRVNLGGTYYNAFKDSGIENCVGKMIEAEITTNEKFGPGIAAFRVVTEQNAAPQVSPAPSAASNPPSPAVAAPIQTGKYEIREPVYAEPAKPGTVAPYWIQMASNICASAIQAGVLKSPGEVNLWVSAVRSAFSTQADDDIPF